MARTAGSRNRDYEATRHGLALRLAPALLRDDGEPASFTDLAAAAGVSPTTLKHYFGDRAGVFAAAMEAVRIDSRQYVEAAMSAGGLAPQASLQALLRDTIEVWRRYGLGRLFATGLALGLENAQRGPAFLSGLLEPFLSAAEGRLAGHVERGELPELDVRPVALSLVAPVVLALLHQDNLGGSRTRPLDVHELAAAHARLVLAGLLAAQGGEARAP